MLQPPRWCQHAVPTARGWTDPSTGEVFVARRFTQEEIDGYFGKVEEAVQEMYGLNEPVEVEAPQMLNEAPANNKSLSSMTKNELLALAEQKGIAVSKFSTKKTLVEKLS